MLFFSIIKFFLQNKIYKLSDLLAKIGVANAIEADVRMGFIKKGKEDVDVQADVKADLMAPNELTRDKKQIPIMSHTEDSSDLSLEEFLKQIVSHNQKNRTTAKIAKLDFKQTEALKTSVENVLQAKWENIYV